MAITLKEFFQENPRTALAFSGGVDSAFLLHAAVKYGAEVRAYYVKTAFQPMFELEDARRLAAELEADMMVLELDVLSDPQIIGNPADRCYHCKKVDLHRKIRQGAAEVIYGAGKTPKQIIGILDVMEENGQKTILITRLSEEAAAVVGRSHPLDYHRDAKVAIVGPLPEQDGMGKIVVATGGTSDIPVAEEAALTAQVLGNKVVRLYDVGVAGLHRTLAHLDDIMSASVIIAIAGMEGALASVIGGLADCPVIAVPTSVGYGASFQGLSALLSMLNSCASGVSVVNIDNGFGAGYLASMINHMDRKQEV